MVCATSSNHAFLCAKAISDAKGGLFVPSSGLTNVLEQNGGVICDIFFGGGEYLYSFKK